MAWHKEIWTYAVVTVVTVLIWVWAAGETREQKTFGTARVQFTVADETQWMISPRQQAVSIVVDGPKLAVQNFEQLVHRPVRMNVTENAGKQPVDLMARLRVLDAIRATGVTITSVEPSTADVELDPIERTTSRIKPMLPGITTEGEVTIDPPEATIAMPSQVRQFFGSELNAEAFVDRFDLDRLTPGVRQTLDVKLRLPEGAALGEGVSITPVKAKISFTIRSRLREVMVATVRVQLSQSDEKDAYSVSIEPKQLEDVVISADADLIRRIETNEVPVVAVLHLSAREKELKTETKRITYFMALVPQPNGDTIGIPVKARVNNSDDSPLIKLRISEKKK